jgi:hypothetical protein
LLNIKLNHEKYILFKYGWNSKKTIYGEGKEYVSNLDLGNINMFR